MSTSIILQMVLDKEIIDREKTEDILNQQLIYQQALERCSRSLLVPADNKDIQQNVLNQALEHLRSGAEASRAYIVHIFDDLELGHCMTLMAEVCAPGVIAHIDFPGNQRIPLSLFPSEMLNMLAEEKPYGGPAKKTYATAPQVLKEFLNRKHPLLSNIVFPIFGRDQWSSFVGFDDCETEREWKEREILILRTASEMVGNTQQHWQTAAQLQDTLDSLEQRVEERTADLDDEIQDRRCVQF